MKEHMDAAVYAEPAEEAFIISDEKADKARESKRAEAEKTIKDKKLIEKLLGKAEKLFGKIRRFGKSLAYVPTLVHMVRDSVKGEYKVSPQGLIAITCGLLYLVSVFDIIPDVIPFVGYSDDAAVIAGVIKIVKDELDAYTAWRQAKQNSPETEEMSITPEA